MLIRLDLLRRSDGMRVGITTRMRFIIRNVQTAPTAADCEEFDQFRDLALNALENSEFFGDDEKGAPVVVESPTVVARQPSRLSPPLIELFATLCIT